MLRRLRAWLKPPPKTAEDVAARAEGRQIREELKTQGTGGFGVPPGRAQGGRTPGDPY